MGSVDVRFNRGTGCGDRSIQPFSVQFVDGQTKVLLMLAVVAFCSELEFGETELSNDELQKVLNSFTSVRANYEHQEHAALHSLRSLSILPALICSCFSSHFEMDVAFPRWFLDSCFHPLALKLFC